MARISRINIAYSTRAGLLASALMAAGAFAQAPSSSAPPAAASPVQQVAAPVAASATPPAAAPAATHAASKPAASAPAAAKPAVAPIAMEKPLWKDLSPLQQRVLDPLKGEWDKLEGLRKQKWLEIANRYNAMKPEEQARAQERMRDWVRLTPDQRRQVRENFARAQKVAPAPGQKSAQWEQYQQLPDEQKKILADKQPKKQVVNPPTPAQSKIPTVQPVKRAAPGSVPATGAPGSAPQASSPAAASAAATAAPAAAGTPAASSAPATSTPPASNVK